MEQREILSFERTLRVQWVVGMLGHKDHSAYLRAILGPGHDGGLAGATSEALTLVEVQPNVDWLHPTPSTRLQVCRSLLACLPACLPAVGILTSCDCDA
jgi:hypothetical protein